MKVDSRPLTDSERRLVRWHIYHLSRLRRRHWPRFILIGLLVFLPLWIITLMLSDAPLLVITAFWLALGAAIIVWVGRDQWRPPQLQIEQLRAVLRDGNAVATDLTCVGYVEVEEREDEGAALILELEGRKLTFLSGQENYPSPRFPSREITFIELRTSEGSPVLSSRRCKGGPLRASRMLPSSARTTMRWPGDGEIVDGTLEDTEKVLGLPNLSA